MADYYLTPEAIQATQKSIVKRLSAFAAVLSIFLLCYNILVIHADLIVIASTILMLIGTTLYIYFRNLKQQKILIQSYRLSVEQDYISRTQAIIPDIQLASTEIIGITENTQGTLTITSADKYRLIYVPLQIENRETLLRELSRFAPLTVLIKKTSTEILAPFVGVGMIGLMGIFYVVNNKIVSTCTGVLILGILAWSAWHIWRNKNLPQQSRRLLWFLPIVFLSILAGVIARLVQ